MIPRKESTLQLLSVQKIWDKGEHAAFTDLIEYRGNLFCAFREGTSHQDTKGSLRILSSSDGIEWKSCALISDPDDDLRDPKLSIDPIGRLVLNCGALSQNLKGEYRDISSKITFSNDGTAWAPMRTILKRHEWLWRLTWRLGYAYGVSYQRLDPTDRHSYRILTLYRTQDGLDYEKICELEVTGYPSETVLRFRADGTMVALVRRDGKEDRLAWIGESQPPYQEWNWMTLSTHVGGPNFLILPDESLLIGGRLLTVSPYGFVEKTFLGRLHVSSVNRILLLPSGLDCSYPGMVLKDNVLYVSYYSSHEGKSAIYLARLTFYL